MLKQVTRVDVTKNHTNCVLGLCVQLVDMIHCVQGGGLGLGALELEVCWQGPGHSKQVGRAIAYQ